ncbi:MAG: hypothetical protein Q9227_001541 [Pyrenula ochraceoflavens]
MFTCRLQLRYAAVAAVVSLSGTYFTARRNRLALDAPILDRDGRTQRALLERQHRLSEQHPSSYKRGDADLITKPSVSAELDVHAVAFEDDDTSAWREFSRNFDKVLSGIRNIEWSKMSDHIADFIVPAWAQQIPGFVDKLNMELSMEKGSLADDIWQEAHDPDINPEILWDARVRVGDELCPEEKEYIQKRKAHVVKALAKYLDLEEKDINPEDVPTIALCGSGGGLRALVAGLGSYLSATEAGLFDCATYTAGVSGSCWLQTLFNSSLGNQSLSTLSKHLKNRLDIHIAFPPPALKLVTSAPTNKYLLSGFVEKLKGDPGAEFGLVDVYGLLLAARLLVPKGELSMLDRDLKLSNQRAFTDNGSNPLPIYTAVRHEIPLQELEGDETTPKATLKERAAEKAKKEAWFQWFEFTPYEFFCEELSAGIPTWALGRSFNNGRNVILETGVSLPEIRVPLLMGIWASAFCATLSHYYKEIRPAVLGISGLGGLDDLMEEKNEDLIKIHPIDPPTIPNYVYGMKEQLPPTCPESIFKNDHLQLMDAGMSNNLPCYPLLRPGRDVDILVAFDASAEVKKDNWLSVVDGYARQRGIKGWPLGAGWPKPSAPVESQVKDLDKAQAKSPEEAADKVSHAQTHEPGSGNEAPNPNQVSASSNESLNNNNNNNNNADEENDSELTYCNVWWVGSEFKKGLRNVKHRGR